MLKLGLCAYFAVVFVTVAVTTIRIERAIVKLVPGATMTGAYVFAVLWVLTLVALVVTILGSEVY